jgi:hypothetical protein
MDLLKGYISKIQQLESELMRQNFSNACRHGLHDQLAMDQDIFLNELGSGCEVGTPDASSKLLRHFLKALIMGSGFLFNSCHFSELSGYAYNIYIFCSWSNNYFFWFSHMMINLDFASEAEP